MKKPTLHTLLALFPMLLATTAVWAGGKHGGAGIALPSAHLSDSPWLLMGAVTLVSIIAFRLFRSTRG